MCCPYIPDIIDASQFAHLLLNVANFHDVARKCVHIQEIYVGAHLVDDFAGIYFKYTLSAEGVRRKKMLLAAVSQ